MNLTFDKRDFEKQGAQMMLPELITKYELRPELVSIDTRMTETLNGLYLFYRGVILGIFESSIRQEGLKYHLDIVFHPTHDAHILVGKINAEREYFEEKVKAYKKMRGIASTGTPEQQKDFISGFRCGVFTTPNMDKYLQPCGTFIKEENNISDKGREGQYVIIDLSTTEFMKDSEGNIKYYNTKEEACMICGIYEFENVWVMKVIYNHRDEI